MKTSLGVGISVLSAQAAQGKDFDRAERNMFCSCAETVIFDTIYGVKINVTI